MAPTVLVIRHEEFCGPGHVGRWLGEAGVRVVEVRPYAGEPVPDRVEADGLVVCGGELGAEEDQRGPWLPATRALLRRAVEERVPTLGLCLGGQLLA
ncbi:MAG: type 1 glutamine amidotransferase, partial [Actinomycetes bacterium]